MGLKRVKRTKKDIAEFKRKDDQLTNLLQTNKLFALSKQQFPGISEEGLWPVDIRMKSLKGKKSERINEEGEKRDAMWGHEFLWTPGMRECTKCGKAVESTHPKTQGLIVWDNFVMEEVMDKQGESEETVRSVCGSCQKVMGYNYRLKYAKEKGRQWKQRRGKGTPGIKKFKQTY